MTDVTIREIQDLRELEDEHPAPVTAPSLPSAAEMDAKLADARALIARLNAKYGD
jgi:hypothetical protein